MESDKYKDFLETMSREEKLVRKAALLSILEGAPATIADISQRSGLAPQTAAALVKRLLDYQAIVADINGAIVGSWGLSLLPSNHRLLVNSKELYTWCAQDIVGIPAALELDAVINSSCHHCGKPIVIVMSKGQLVSTNQPDIHVWLAEREFGRPSLEST